MAEKVRVNITVDKDKLRKAKQKLNLFGGKLSTLFNAYLSDFVDTIGKEAGSQNKEMKDKVEEVEERLKKLEEKIKRRK